jgi:hypothetical protein
MASKQVIDRQKSAEAVAAVGEAQAEDIGKGLRALLQPHLLPGETMPDTVLLTRLLGRALVHRKDTLIAADQANEAELVQDAEARAGRDERSAVLYQRMTALRPALSGLYGSDVAAAMMPGTTPQDPVALSRYAVEVSSALVASNLPGRTPAHPCHRRRDRRAPHRPRSAAHGRCSREARDRGQPRCQTPQSQ